MEELPFPSLYDQYRIWADGRAGLDRRLKSYYEHYRGTSPAVKCIPIFQKYLENKLDKDSCLSQIRSYNLPPNDRTLVRSRFIGFVSISEFLTDFRPLNWHQYSIDLENDKKTQCKSTLGISGERENRPVLHIAQLRTDTAPNEGDYAYIFSVLRKMFGKFPLTDIQIYDVRSKKKSNFNNDISRPPSSVSKLITASKVECMDQEEMNNVLY